MKSDKVSDWLVKKGRTGHRYNSNLLNEPIAEIDITGKALVADVCQNKIGSLWHGVMKVEFVQVAGKERAAPCVLGRQFYVVAVWKIERANGSFLERRRRAVGRVIMFFSHFMRGLLAGDHVAQPPACN